MIQSYFEVVLVDLETTSLDQNRTEICQISALHRSRIFNRYMVPTRRIHPRATEVNGFTTYRGTLLLHGQAVETTPVKTALREFLDFLISRARPWKPRVILAAHNGLSFDFTIIERHMRNKGLLRDYENIVAGFVDTIEVFKKCGSPLLRDNKYFSQKVLVEKYLGKEMYYGAHNAETDVKNLRALLLRFNISWREVVQRAYYW